MVNGIFEVVFFRLGLRLLCQLPNNIILYILLYILRYILQDGFLRLCGSTKPGPDVRYHPTFALFLLFLNFLLFIDDVLIGNVILSDHLTCPFPEDKAIFIFDEVLIYLNVIFDKLSCIGYFGHHVFWNLFRTIRHKFDFFGNKLVKASEKYLLVG